jgi:hypothetical protein
MDAKIKQVIVKNNLNISESEFWSCRYLGIDTIQRKVLFLDISETESLEQQLDLNNVKGFQILENKKVLTINDKKEILLERLDLEVTFKNSERILLNFYDADQEPRQDFELQRIEKWKTILNGYIPTMPLIKKVA